MSLAEIVGVSSSEVKQHFLDEGFTPLPHFENLDAPKTAVCLIPQCAVTRNGIHQVGNYAIVRDIVIYDKPDDGQHAEMILHQGKTEYRLLMPDGKHRRLRETQTESGKWRNVLPRSVLLAPEGYVL